MSLQELSSGGWSTTPTATLPNLVREFGIEECKTALNSMLRAVVSASPTIESCAFMLG